MPSSRAIILKAFGGYEQLVVQDVEIPKPAANEVLVQMKACGMNFSDIHNRHGIYTFGNIKPPFVMGAEGAGIVREHGKDVEQFRLGDRVMCWKFSYGLWSEYAAIPATQCYHMPAKMSFEEAACIPINYVTAYLAIMDFGGLRAGQSVLIQCAAGGVGWAATQLARTVPNVTVFGTASTRKLDQIKENGVQHPIAYRSKDFVEEVLQASPRGVNIVLDCLSGRDFTRSQDILRPTGRLIHIGISNSITGERFNVLSLLKVYWQAKNICLRSLIDKNRSVCGLNLANLEAEDPNVFLYALEQVLKMYEECLLKPRIDSTWTFDQVVEASQQMIERKNVGKIILVPRRDSDE